MKECKYRITIQRLTNGIFVCKLLNSPVYCPDDDENGIKYSSSFSMDAINWLNANHFDYRGLIPMGLAIEVTKENNPYEHD